MQIPIMFHRINIKVFALYKLLKILKIEIKIIITILGIPCLINYPKEVVLVKKSIIVLIIKYLHNYHNKKVLKIVRKLLAILQPIFLRRKDQHL